jgi:hypothetical protein
LLADGQPALFAACSNVEEFQAVIAHACHRCRGGREYWIGVRYHVSLQKALKCKISPPIVVDLRTKNPNLEHSPDSIANVHPSWWALDAKARRSKTLATCWQP